MAFKFEKICDLDYNELATINVIESDEDLRAIFIEDVNMSFNMIKKLSVEGKLSEKTKKLIQDFFDKIILTKESLCDKYNLFLANNNISTDSEQLTDKVIQPKNKNNKLPKWYGKAKITKDIQNQGGKATNTQITALAVNDLKNIYINLNNRMIHDMLSGSQILNDEEYREIRATITILKNKMKPILKKRGKNL